MAHALLPSMEHGRACTSQSMSHGGKVSAGPDAEQQTAGDTDTTQAWEWDIRKRPYQDSARGTAIIEQHNSPSILRWQEATCAATGRGTLQRIQLVIVLSATLTHY